MRPLTLYIFALLLIGLSLTSSVTDAEGSARPNIVLIVADDLGIGDVGAYGASLIKTPNIDELAREGVRLVDAHAPDATCGPTRYAILSGQYLRRRHPRRDGRLLFDQGQVTLPALFKQAGYRTAAIGKWHLGFGPGGQPNYNGELKPGPLEVGFDYYFGTPNTHNEPPFVFVENHRVLGLDPADPIRIVSQDEAVKRGLESRRHGLSEGGAKAHAARPDEKIDLILAEKASEIIAQESESPLFLYLAFAAPHIPINPSLEFRGTSQAGPYGDYVQQLDAYVGVVLSALRAKGLADNTLVIFTSDNGAYTPKHGGLKFGHRSNGIFLGQKTDAWEGGHRVPFIARWPGRIPPGTVASQLFGLTDLMATLAAAADIPIPDGAGPDSLNQLSVLTDPAHAPPVRTEFLTGGMSCLALRQGDYIYLPTQGSCGHTVRPEGMGLWWSRDLAVVNSDIEPNGRIKPGAPSDQLYNLATDPGQTTNIATSEPQRAAAMRKRLQELGAFSSD